MDFDLLFPARFLKAGELQGKTATLTMSAVQLEDLVGDKGAERRGIVSFAETKKQLVLNKTNALCIRAMFGRDTDAWIGKRITLYPAPIEYGDATHAIRVAGSPDIPADVEFDLKLARKKPRTITLKRGV